MSDDNKQTLAEYMAEQGITIDVEDAGQFVHHGHTFFQYEIVISYNGRSATIEYSQGPGIDNSPSERADEVVDAFTSDAFGFYDNAEDAEDPNASDFVSWARAFGYDANPDAMYTPFSRKADMAEAAKTWEACKEQYRKAVELFGRDVLHTIWFDVERP